MERNTFLSSLILSYRDYIKAFEVRKFLTKQNDKFLLVFGKIHKKKQVSLRL